MVENFDTTNLNSIRNKAIRTGVGINDAEVTEIKKGDEIKTTIKNGLRGGKIEYIETNPEKHLT